MADSKELSALKRGNSSRINMDALLDPVDDNPVRIPGKVFIFIQGYFGEKYFERNGTKIDQNTLIDAFVKQGYEVESYIDNSAEEILSTLNQASASNYDRYEQLVVIIISHFASVGEIMTKNGNLTEDNVLDYFEGKKCPSLLTKPKLFIFQTSKCTKKIAASPTSLQFDGDNNEPSLKYTLPNEANFLIVRSSYEGGPSHKPGDTGSWVIQKFCEHLKRQDGTSSILTMITNIFNDIRNNREQDFLPTYTAMPELTSTLIEDLYLGNSKNVNPTKADLSFDSKNFITYTQKSKMGKLYIINYDKVIGKENEPREGSKIDANSIIKCFAGLGFEWVELYDEKKDDLFYKLKKNLAASPLEEYTCIAIIVMTHGLKGKLGAKDALFSEKELYNVLSIPRLTGIPKLLFIQACRGIKPSVSVEPTEPQESETSESREYNNTSHNMTAEVDARGNSNERENTYPLQYEDSLVFHSTFHDCSSVRIPVSGTWFIQSLCTQLKESTLHKSVSLLELLRMVSKQVAEQQGFTSSNIIAKQMPVIRSNLTKFLILNKFHETLEKQAPQSKYYKTETKE